MRSTHPPLASWMRAILLATAGLNLMAAGLFFPTAAPLREFMGFPAQAPALYLQLLSGFILIFGLAYLWAGLKAQADVQFIAVASAGKLCFSGLLLWHWLAGSLPLLAALSGLSDLLLGLAFLYWLQTQQQQSLPEPELNNRGTR